MESSHDDVIKWKHFPRYWPFVRGIHLSPVNSPQKGQWRGALMPSLICAWINGSINIREAGDLRRHHAHYDVTVMHHTVALVGIKNEMFVTINNKYGDRAFFGQNSIDVEFYSKIPKIGVGKIGTAGGLPHTEIDFRLISNNTNKKNGDPVVRMLWVFFDFLPPPSGQIPKPTLITKHHTYLYDTKKNKNSS